jgi:hypothetical protein
MEPPLAPEAAYRRASGRRRFNARRLARVRERLVRAARLLAVMRELEDLVWGRWKPPKRHLARCLAKALGVLDNICVEEFEWNEGFIGGGDCFGLRRRGMAGW